MHTQSTTTPWALVTGAGRGIGQATAVEFSNRGWGVVLVARSESELNETARLCAGPTRIHSCDLAIPSDIRRLFDTVNAESSSIQLRALINNAGLFVGGALSDMPLEDWDRVYALNARGTFLMCQEALRIGGPMVVINVATVGAIQGVQKFPGFSAYTSSKAAVIALTECMAVEIAASKQPAHKAMRCHAVAPGAVDTVMLREAAPFFKNPATPQTLGKFIVDLCLEPASTRPNGSIIEADFTS